MVLQNYGLQLVLLVGPFKEAHLAARMSDRCRCRTTSSHIATGMGHPVRLTCDGELRKYSKKLTFVVSPRQAADALRHKTRLLTFDEEKGAPSSLTLAR